MASIATLYCTVLPETSRIADGITKAFLEVDPKAREAGRRWGREIESGIGETNVKLKADTREARAEIDDAARDRKSDVEVSADTARARAEIDEVARDRKAHITVDSGALTSSVTRAAPAVSSSLSGAMPAVGSALSTALIAGGVTAAAGVAAALSGAIGLIPAGLGGGVAVLGTLVTGLDGVKDAWDAAGKAADSATKDQEEKSKAVASAQRSLKDAVEDEANAQKDVANARKDARQQLEDLNVQLRGGVLDEKSAILDAQAARRDLATGRYKDAIEYQQAQLRVQQADQRVLESHERNVELQGKATDANAKGVDQNDQVVAANQRLERSHDAVAAARRNLADAEKPTGNQESLIQSMAKLSPVAQGFVNTLVGLKPAWQSLKFGVQDSLLAGIGPEIATLTTQYLPTLKSAMGGLAGTMNAAFKDVGAWLSKPETMATIQTIVANIGSSFQQWSQSIVPFSNAFLTITQVGSKLLPGLAQMITDGANAFNNFIQNASRTGELQHWMQVGIDTMHELMKLVPVLGKMFMDLAPVAIPALHLIGTFVQAIEPSFKPLIATLATMTQALAQHPGLIYGVVVAFGAWKAITVVDSVLTALTGIRTALKAMPAEAAIAGEGMAASLGPILGTLTTAATALTLWNSKGSAPDPNIGPGGDERKRKLDAGKAYADAHGGKVPDRYQQWLDNKGPMPPELGQYYQAAPPAAPTPLPTGGWWGGGGHPATRGFAAPPGVAPSSVPTPTLAPSAFPSAVTGSGDSAILAGVPAGKYLQTQAADLTKGIGDCSSAVEDLINIMDGVSTAGRGMSTANGSQWLTAHGFLPTNTPVPGAFNVGFNDHHMQATLPGGTNFNWGSDAAAAQRGIGGTGAWDPAFTQHFYRYPSAAGMPTVASPQGVSPEGMPLGTQQSPMYVMPAMSGGQQLGQDFLSGIGEIFGVDGSLFKSPLDTGLFKGFKGLMSAITGGGKGGGGGLPAAAFSGAGGDGGALPGVGGGGDIFSSLLNMGGSALKGVTPQAFGNTVVGGPAEAPTSNVLFPTGNNTFDSRGGGMGSLPSNLTPGANQLATGQNGGQNTVNHNSTYVFNGTPPPGSNDFANNINVQQARSTFRGRVPGFSI